MTTANGTMALIAVATTTAAAVAMVVATAAEKGSGGEGAGVSCVGCWQMVVARKSQKPLDFFRHHGRKRKITTTPIQKRYFRVSEILLVTKAPLLN